MSGAMVLDVFAMLAPYWAGGLANVAVDNVSTLWLSPNRLTMPAMLVPVLLRLDAHTGACTSR
jgi:hypothetical protein